MKKVFLDKQNRVRSGFQILIGLLIFLLMQTISFVVMDNLILQLLVTIVQLAVMLGMYGYFFKWIYKNKRPVELDCFAPNTLKRSLSYLGFGMIAGIIIFSLAVVPLYATGQYHLVFRAVDVNYLMRSFALFILVGFGEELLTRGVMQHALYKYGQWPALLIVSGIFSLLHLGNPGVTSGALVGVFVAGLLLGMLMLATRSISTAIGFHITWNWIQGAIYGINVSGTDTGNSLFQTEVTGENILITGGAFGAEASYVTIGLLLVVTGACFYYWYKQVKTAD